MAQAWALDAMLDNETWGGGAVSWRAPASISFQKRTRRSDWLFPDSGRCLVRDWGCAVPQLSFGREEKPKTITEEV